MSPSHPIRRLLDLLAKAPLWVVAVLLITGGILAGIQQGWIAAVHSAGAAEPPQWLARLTVMQVNIVIPLALLMIWSRRRVDQGRTGVAGAVLLTVLPVVHILLTVATVVWGGILGRGDIVYPMMGIEYLGLLSYLGIVVSGVAWMRDDGAPRLIGPLIVVGFVMNFVVPGGLLIGYGLLAFVIVRTRLVRRAPRRLAARR